MQVKDITGESKRKRGMMCYLPPSHPLNHPQLTTINK